jgi:DNA invertase Pin-like site-specific DNA recombinase
MGRNPRIYETEELLMTLTGTAVPAAQYLRMSTERQEYSFDNQRQAIGVYAAKAGFIVTHTYGDAGKSGLDLKRRDGLRQLLNDVVGGNQTYKAILVYDISRWGRFQDADEAAHYEFVCKAAGLQVHYCAEQFANDNSLPSSMMKGLKRIMAGEFSRELSVKVSAGIKRVSQNGFRTGGTPGYGLRRMLVSASREPKCLLARGERKSLQTDRVILVPGPDYEVRCVRDMFRMFTEEQKWPSAIAAELRAKGVSYNGSRRTAWYALAVNRLLKNPNYCGCSVYGHYRNYLGVRRTTNPRNLWTITRGAWQPIIDEDTFNRAQSRFEDQTIHKSDADLLAGLGRLLAERGKISVRLLNDSAYLPSIGPYVDRFGSLSEACAKINYIGRHLAATRSKRVLRALRDQILAEIVATHPNHITVVQRDGHFRPRLRVSGRLVSVYLCRNKQYGDVHRWVLSRSPRERNRMAILIFLNPGNNTVKDLFVVPDTESHTRYMVSLDDPFLRRGKKLGSAGDFLQAVRLLDVRRKNSGQWESAEQAG